MPVYKTLQRQQEAINFTPNSSGSAKLQRNYNYSYIIFELVVNYKAQTGATFKYLNFANLIKNFQIFANGSTEFKNLNFAQLVYQTYIYTRGKLFYDIPQLPAKDATQALTATHTLRVIVPFASLLMTKPSDTGLQSNQFQTLDYLINWNDASAVGTGIEIISAQLKPTSFEKIETLAKGEQVNNMKLVQKLQSEQITTTTTGYLINLPAQKQYQYFQFDLQTGSTGDAAPNTIKNIKFLNGTDVIVQLSIDTLKAMNRLRYGIDDNAFKSIYSAYITTNQVLNPDAHFVLDFSDRGHYSNSWDIKDFKAPQIALDTDLSSLNNASLNVNIAMSYAEAN
ncbi:MAG: hypothetical protein K2P17_03960 [Helicobacteraceae bacterium]|nr:hypothetical protein [Helicobacteraceae bacterium]